MVGLLNRLLSTSYVVCAWKKSWTKKQERIVCLHYGCSGKCETEPKIWYCNRCIFPSWILVDVCVHYMMLTLSCVWLLIRLSFFCYLSYWFWTCCSLSLQTIVWKCLDDEHRTNGVIAMHHQRVKQSKAKQKVNQRTANKQSNNDIGTMPTTLSLSSHFNEHWWNDGMLGMSLNTWTLALLYMQMHPISSIDIH